MPDSGFDADDNRSESVVNESMAADSLKPNEIREIEQNDLPEKTCFECNETLTCKFKFLHETPSTDNEPATNEPQFICSTECATKFKSKNEGYELVLRKINVQQIAGVEMKCSVCDTNKTCRFRYKTVDTDPYTYVCEDDCLNKLTETDVNKFQVVKQRFLIEELPNESEDAHKCFQCTEEKKCKFAFKQGDEDYYLCQTPCVNILLAEQPERFQTKRQSIRVKEFPRKSETPSSDNAPILRESKRLSAGKSKMVSRSEVEARMTAMDREASFIRRCAQCFSDIFLDERNLQWETMDFCNESCLGLYQSTIGAACTTCQSAVSMTSMGKYCVRFGFELRQFCRSNCLDVFKKGLKVCSHCQKDINKNEEFLAPFNGKFKDFCTRKCMRMYEQICGTRKSITKMCGVCNNSKVVKVEVIIDSTSHYFCSNPCFSAFKFVNNIVPGKCLIKSLAKSEFCFNVNFTLSRLLWHV